MVERGRREVIVNVNVNMKGRRNSFKIKVKIKKVRDVKGTTRRFGRIRGARLP